MNLLGSEPQDSSASPDDEGPFATVATTVGVRELALNTTGVIDDVVASGRPAIITDRGIPVAAIVPIETGR